ncbi:MAG: electron transfer flavoprotein subunit beta/FixA family protein [Candidatus Methanoplasma sp.]|nr:electron transfer flavoprotein subunit beta/FixA family protein [Candidatus Methanoplasma sp.]
MRIIVFVKQVPDTDKVSVDGEGRLVRSGAPAVMDAYSECALDMACGLAGDGDEVIAASMGPPGARAALLRCLELGAGEAFLICDPAFAGSDAHATATVLSAFAMEIAPGADLILCGKQASDGDTAEVPPELAEKLGAPQFCYVEDIRIEGGSMLLVQNYGDELRACRHPLGALAVASVSKGGANRRLPSVSAYLRAAAMEIKTVDAAALRLPEGAAGARGSKTRIASTMASGAGRRGEAVDGSDPALAASAILRGMAP